MISLGGVIGAGLFVESGVLRETPGCGTASPVVRESAERKLTP